MKTPKIFLTLILAWFAGTMIASAQQSPAVRAELQPDSIGLDDSTRLEVTVSGAEALSRPQLPPVDGLHFRAAGQSSQIRIINGQMSSSANFSYHVTANREGAFTIPPISVRSAGGVAETESLTLKVTASRGLAAPNPGSKTTPQGAESLIAQELAFLEVERAESNDRQHLYVGEMTPIAIRAFFREGVQVSLSGRPTLAEGSFTLRGLSEEPEQRRMEIDGQIYRVVTWYGALTGVKGGDFELKASLEANLGVPQPRQARRSPRGFNDPFFDSFFDGFLGRVEQREVSLESEPLGVTVRALPEVGRPDHFAGAVGQFTISDSKIPAEMHTGDPATLEVTVSGRGNFDRVPLPTLMPGEDWKVYTAKDRFDAGDRVGLSGEKRFEVPVIAQQPGTRELRFSLAYFDPEKGSYEVADGPVVPVVIEGKPVVATTPPTAPATQPVDPDALAPLRSDLGRVLADFTPLYRQGWFMAAQAGTSLVFLSLLGLLVARRHQQAHPERALLRESNRAIAAELAEVETARIQQDVPSFFASGRRALQLKLSRQWSDRAEAITTEEVVRRLSPDTDVAHFFTMADAAEFAGARPDPESLKSWQGCLEKALADLDEISVAKVGSRESRAWGQVAPRTS